ncbi:MAG: putative beta-barrel porin 2, partial [Pseudomonadota bacterium]
NRQVITSAGPFEDKLKIYSARFGYQRNFGARIQLTAGISYNRAEPNPTTQLAFQAGQIVSISRDGFSGSGFDLALALKPSQRLSVTVIGTRDVSATPNVGAAFVVNQQYGLDMNYAIGPSLTFGLGGTRNVRDYRGGFVTIDERRVRVRDGVNRVYAQLDYQPVPLYAIGVEVAHQKRTSNPADFSYASTTAMLNLRVKLGKG